MFVVIVLYVQNFIDLAGSERASQALSAGARLKEGCHINRSLLTLGTVIRKLRCGTVLLLTIPNFFNICQSSILMKQKTGLTSFSICFLRDNVH